MMISSSLILIQVVCMRYFHKLIISLQRSHEQISLLSTIQLMMLVQRIWYWFKLKNLSCFEFHFKTYLLNSLGNTSRHTVVAEYRTSSLPLTLTWLKNLKLKGDI